MTGEIERCDEPSPEMVAALRELAIIPVTGDLPPMTALTGGVSSEIWRVDLPAGALVAKRALPRLRVAGVWLAPVERTRFEVAWMHRAEAVVPGVTPGVVASNGRVFVMRHLADHRLWKRDLLDGRADDATADAVGDRLGAIHAATADRNDVRAEFDDTDLFTALRLDPYFEAAASAHPDRNAALRGIVDTFWANRRVLVHGDVSPKNVLVGAAGPVLLDAECATWGDASFDLGFATTHLLLKCWHRPDVTDAYLASAIAMADSYRSRVTWEDVGALDRRCAALVAGLLLARIDGLSPVEYLDDRARAGVRTWARDLLAAPASSLDELLRSCRARIDQVTAE